MVRDTHQSQDQLILHGLSSWGAKVVSTMQNKLIVGSVVRVRFGFGVGLQEMNVSLCNFPKCDPN